MSTGGTQDWFYHAPERKNARPVDYPAPSQIPGLSSLAQDIVIDADSGAKLGWIKDTDTKYIKLAKMGGRRDLLRHRENGAPNTEAKAYPRCEWFDYMEYSGPQDSGPHRSYLPDYMVYKEFNPQDQPENMDSRDKPKRPPYSLGDNLSAFQRDGNTVTDKTIKLPEIDRQYNKGVVFKVKKDKMAGGVRPTDPQKGQRNKGRYQTGPSPPKEQNVTFSKLMSMSYQDEWLKQRKEEHQNQQRTQEQQKTKDTAQNKITTEYREIICKDQQNQKSTSHSVPKIRHTKASEARKRRDSEDDKELFKLNRFTKVGAKVDSHWHGKTDDSYSMQLAAVHV